MEDVNSFWDRSMPLLCFCARECIYLAQRLYLCLSVVSLCLTVFLPLFFINTFLLPVKKRKEESRLFHLEAAPDIDFGDSLKILSVHQ